MKISNKRVLILFRGYPATGKSHLSKQLSKHLKMPLIIRDKFKTTLIKKNYDSALLGIKSYEIMWAMAEKYLQSASGCICDTSLVQPTGIDRIEQIMKRHGAYVLIIECFCIDVNIHSKRLEMRRLYPSYYSINSSEQYEKFVQANKQFEDFIFSFTTVKVDTSQGVNIENFAEFIIQIIRNGEKGNFWYGQQRNII